MYEENEKKINWISILKKSGIILGIILAILAIVGLINGCSKKKVDTPTPPPEANLEAQLDQLEEATLKYLTADNLPIEINSSKTIRLKILISKNLISNIVTEDNLTCNSNESYSEVTRLENNYALKTSITCGNKKDSRVIYIGCFESCNGGVCEGLENDKGICGETVTPPQEDDEKEDSKPSNPSTTVKPSTPNKPTTPSKPTTSNKPNIGGSNSTKLTEYEYQKCDRIKACDRGELNANGECEVYGYVTLYDKVLKKPGSTYTAYRKEKATCTSNTTTVYFNKATEAKNTATVTYKFVKILSSGKLEYKKTETVCSCSNKNVKPVGGYCSIPYTATKPATYDCEHANLGYKYSNGSCTKQEYKIIEINPPVYKKAMCQTFWSTNPNLPGWTKTGNTR